MCPTEIQQKEAPTFRESPVSYGIVSWCSAKLDRTTSKYVHMVVVINLIQENIHSVLDLVLQDWQVTISKIVEGKVISYQCVHIIWPMNWA